MRKQAIYRSRHDPRRSWSFPQTRPQCPQRRLDGMPPISRFFLLVTAAICGGFFTLSGAGVSRAMEPEQFTAGTILFWFLGWVALTIPLWLPALFPSRHTHSFKICRRICALLLLYPTWLFGTIVTHNVSRAFAGLGATPVALAQGLILTLCCLACLFVLLLPDIRRNENIPS